MGGNVEQGDSGSLTNEKWIYLTRDEVARVGRCSKRTIDREVAAGRLKKLKNRGRTLFSQKAVDRWLRTWSQNVS